MKKISDILRKKQVLYPPIALAGFVLGWLLFSPSSSPESAGGTHAEAHNHDMHGTSHDLVQDESGVWTCSMHPQIRRGQTRQMPYLRYGPRSLLRRTLFLEVMLFPIPMPSGYLMRPWLSPMFRLPVSVAVTP